MINNTPNISCKVADVVKIPTKRQFLAMLPAIRIAAATLGYAVGVHGSLNRDFDLMAVPWTKDAAHPDDLAKAIKDAAGCVRWRVYRDQGEPKPHGRMVYCFDWDKNNYECGGYIDLSVMPHCYLRMLPNFQPQDITKVFTLIEQVKTAGYHQHKKDNFTKGFIRLSDEQKYLCSVLIYLSLFCSRLKPVDMSRYYAIPLKEHNESTFEDLLEVLRYYDRKRVTSTRETKFIEFISKLDQQHFTWYSWVFSHTLHEKLPLTEVQMYCDFDSINIEDIYGLIEILHTPFENLHYPLAITKISNPDALFVVHSATPKGSITRTLADNQLTKIKTSFLKTEKVFLKQPVWTLAGFLDKQQAEVPQRGKRSSSIESLKFCPTDYFSTAKEYNSYFKGEPVTKFSDRIKNLNSFIESNFTTQIQSNYVGFANSEHEVLPEIQRVLNGEEVSYVLIADENSAKTKVALAVEVRVVDTIIEDFYLDSGKVLGYNIWHNGVLQVAPFKFEGKNGVLLNSITPAKHKVLRSLYLRVNDVPIYYGLEIAWNKATWMPRPLASGIRLTCCILCGSTEYANDNSGVCKSCNQNFHLNFKVNGEGNWIAPGLLKDRKRKKAGWHYSCVDLVKPRYRQYRIEVRPDGYWRFKYDETAEEEYNNWKVKLGLI